MVSFRAIHKAAFALGLALAVSTQAAAPDTIKERQQALKDTGAAFKTVRDELSGGKDVAKIKAAAATINKSANAMVHWFPAGTGTEAKVKTAAKPEVWSDAAGFNSAREKFVAEAGKFQLRRIRVTWLLSAQVFGVWAAHAKAVTIRIV